MKIVLLCGAQPNQVALANKIAGKFELAGIVIERSAATSQKFSFTGLVEKILNRTLFAAIRNAWFGMLEHFRKLYPDFPSVTSIIVNNINNDTTVQFLEKLKPDLVMVSGTSMLKKKLLSLQIPYGIINLHTGLSPYIKGAPNCTNWCIAENKIHFIGNTVMWIDAGIDSGDLIATALTPFDGSESLTALHIKVMEHAHSLYMSAAKKIEDDFPGCPRIKQSSISSGITYYNRQWNRKAKRSLLKNFANLGACIQSEQYKREKNKVITVRL